jgi:hypothetical protein
MGMNPPAPIMSTDLSMDEIMGSVGRMLGEGWSEDTAAADFVKLRSARFVRRLSDLARKAKRGKNTKQAAARIIGSFDARFCAVILGWPKGGKPIRLSAAIEMANRLNPTAPSREVVYVKLLAKPEGGTRPILKFGPERRALQVLAKHVLMAVWGPAKFDFAQRGRGRDRAMDVIVDKTAKKGGARWFLTADIRNCFGSFDREALLKVIPLSKNVIWNCILVPEDTPLIDEYGYRTLPSEIAALSGLPQGSLASPYIASKLIEQVLEQLDGVIVLSHADDIIVGTRTQAQAEANMHRLGDLLADHPAGPLFMKSHIAPLGKPIDYLGYRIRRRALQFGGGVRLIPNPKSFARMEARAYAKLLLEPSATREAKADLYAMDWMNSFPRWDRSPAAKLQLWITIHAHVLPGVSYAITHQHFT